MVMIDEQREPTRGEVARGIALRLLAFPIYLIVIPLGMIGALIFTLGVAILCPCERFNDWFQGE